MLLAYAVLAAVALGQPAADEVLSLPGWSGPLPSRMWSGYVNGSFGEQIHYRLIESEAGAGAPVISWHNGGPPCSSEIGGWLEVGPLKMNGDGTLSLWESRWSRIAHVLIFESPPGVGFSYTPGATLPYAYDDNTMAATTHAALRSFFAAFPSLRDGAAGLWLAGESYAGVYVPMLAAAVLAAPAGIAALKGIAVGNGAIATGDWYEGGLVQQRSTRSTTASFRRRCGRTCARRAARTGPCDRTRATPRWRGRPAKWAR